MRTPRVDDEGYLVDPGDWTEAWAAATASALGVTLTDDHWRVIRFMREYLEAHQVIPDARHAMKHLESHHPGAGRKRMFELFPYSYVGQACRIAGMRRPRAWSTG